MGPQPQALPVRQVKTSHRPRVIVRMKRETRIFHIIINNYV